MGRAKEYVDTYCAKSGEDNDELDDLLTSLSPRELVVWAAHGLNADRALAAHSIAYQQYAIDHTSEEGLEFYRASRVLSRLNMLAIEAGAMLD